MTAGTTRIARIADRVTPRTRTKGSVLAGWLSSTNHKVIGHMYLVTSFVPAACQNGAETTDIER